MDSLLNNYALDDNIRSVMEIVLSQYKGKSNNNPFLQLGFQQIKESIKPHTCSNNFESDLKCFDSKLPRLSVSKPLNRRKSFHTIPGLKRHSKFKKSVQSLPEAEGGWSSNSEWLSDCPSVFSDDSSFKTSGATTPSSNPAIEKRTYSSGSNETDVQIYKAVSACVQHPVLVPCTQQKAVPQKAFLLHKDSSEVSRILSSYLRKLWKLTVKNHADYQHSIQNLVKDQLDDELQTQLLFELQLSEKNEHPYYKPNEFHSVEDYKRWQKLEREEIILLKDKLNGVENPETLPNFSSPRNRCEDYKVFLTRVVNFELKSTTKEASTAGIPESVSLQSSASSFGTDDKILSPKSNRLLREFAMRYRISPLTQSILLLECLVECMESNTLVLGELSTLIELQEQVSSILEFLCDDSTPNLILKSEVIVLNELTDHIIKDLKSLMCSFLTTWKPSKDQLSSALALLHDCYEWQQFYYGDSHDYPGCVKEWFHAAVIDGYESQKDLKCGCDDPCEYVKSAKLLRGVIHSLDAIQNGCSEGFQALFEPYTDDVRKSYAATLYTCVIADIQKWKMGCTQNNGMNNILDFISLTTLPTKLAELENCVLDTGHNPSAEELAFNWRVVFQDLRCCWMTKVDSRMSSSLLSFLQDRGKGFSVNLRGREVIPERKVTSSRTVNFDRHTQSTSTTGETSHVRDIASEQQAPVESEYSDGTERLRLNTIVGAEDAMENIHENSQFTSFNSCAKQDFELCNPPAPFTCSQSGLDLVLLINRFIEMVGGLVQSLFHFPRDLYNSDVQTTAQRNKEFFCIRSFEVVTSTIVQYCDCMLNLDLCDMPVQRVLQYVNAKKIEQLKKRAKNKSVNCCRHQMAGTPTCKDDPDMDTFSIEGTYAVMSKRINNVALLLGGRQVLFESLCHALEIPISIASSVNTSAANSETFGCLSGSYTCNTRTISFDSNESETGSEDTVVFVGPCTQSFEDQDHASDENSSLVCEDGDNENVDHPEAVDSSIQPSDQLDGNNNSEENFRMIDPDSQNQQMNSVSGFTKRFRRSLTMQEGGNQTQERPRPRSSTEGDKVFEPESIMMLGITPLMERCAESAETCVRTLCSVLGWRVTREVRHRLSELLDQPAKFLSRPVSPAGAVFVEMCEEYFQPILSELSHVLNQLSDHVCTQVLIYTHRAIWKLLLEIFRKSVTNLSKGTFDPRKRSFLLLNLFRFLLNIFASFGVLQESELAEDQSTLQLLELYTLSTPKVVTMYESLEENDHPRTRYTMNPHLRKLCQQQKSFSGRQLLLHVSQLYVSLPEYKAKARAQQKCEQLIKQNIISLLFVREVNNCRLPDLVDDTLSSRYGSSTSSAREGASSPASSSGEFTSPLESDSDGGQNVTDPTQFYPDEEHFYAAVLTLSDVPFHHLNELDSDGIDTNHMRCILESRAKHDWEAREFLKQRGHYRRWFQGCLCISL